jgi:hypothetical protein
MRPGYGYVGAVDPGQDEGAPAGDGVFRMDLAGGDAELVLSLAGLAAMRPKPSMVGAKHWVNHVQINTEGSRFACLHRWRVPDGRGKWRTRLVTAGLDGSDPFILLDDDMVSHYDWRDGEGLLAWANVDGVGMRYWLCRDRSPEREVVGEGVLTCDGHCSYSPDRRWVLTDTYPDSDGKRTLLLFRPDDGVRVDLGRFHAGGLKGPVRCDLHPRWGRDGRSVCFDSVHVGTRQMYVMDVSEVVGA